MGKTFRESCPFQLSESEKKRKVDTEGTRSLLANLEKLTKENKYYNKRLFLLRGKRLLENEKLTQLTSKNLEEGVIRFTEKALNALKGPERVPSRNYWGPLERTAFVYNCSPRNLGIMSTCLSQRREGAGMGSRWSEGGGSGEEVETQQATKEEQRGGVFPQKKKKDRLKNRKPFRAMHAKNSHV